MTMKAGPREARGSLKPVVRFLKSLLAKELVLLLHLFEVRVRRLNASLIVRYLSSLPANSERG
jgi:hypothetical protein